MSEENKSKIKLPKITNEEELIAASPAYKARRTLEDYCEGRT